MNWQKNIQQRKSVSRVIVALTLSFVLVLELWNQWLPCDSYAHVTKSAFLGIASVQQVTYQLIWKMKFTSYIQNKFETWTDHENYCVSNLLFMAIQQSHQVLTIPSLASSIESDLISLWMTPFSWRNTSAIKHARQIVAICSSVILHNKGKHLTKLSLSYGNWKNNQLQFSLESRDDLRQSQGRQY